MHPIFRHDPSRRSFLTTAAKTFLGVSLLPTADSVLGAAAVVPQLSSSVEQKEKPLPRMVGKAKNVIYLYMSGGMSHLDTFDVKPGHSVMGATQPIPTNVPGIQISEYLPRVAQCMDRIALINSMNSTQGAHEQGNYLQHTSYTMRGTIKHPSLGAWMMRYQDRFNQSLPASVVIGDSSRHPGSGFMEAKFAPVTLGNPASGLPNVKRMGGVGESDFDYRLKLSSELDKGFQQKYNVKDVRAYTSMYKDAVKLMESRDLAAFDLSKEDATMHRAYGEAPFAQGCLLARRLVEHGVRFVEVTLGGWDTHVGNFVKVPENCEILDRALSSLLEDLGQRGMLEETMVVLATEFGRTPEINVNEGRDHFPKAFTCLMAGAGVRGGMAYGKSTADGSSVAEGLVSPSDFNATIATALGLKLDHQVFSPTKRPFTIADKGRPVMSVLA
jgi:Protein of unknown function (DUF1501)